MSKGGLALTNEVWVYVEKNGKKIRKVSLELMGIGKQISESIKGKLCAVSIGHSIAEQLVEYGVDKEYLGEISSILEESTDVHTDIITKLALNYKPRIILIGSTIRGKELAARVAQNLKTGLASDCIDINVDDSNLVFTRPLYAGKVMAQVTIPDSAPVMATIRPNVFPLRNNYTGMTAELVVVPSEKVSIRQTVKDTILQVGSRPELLEANIIVSGGRGLKAPENFKILEELADVLGASIGATRAAVDSGWAPHRLQVGQTGKTVSPVLYIACGISGAMQHLAGMGSSKCIIAINKDPEANIFKAADYGIVGDLLEVVPLLTSEFRKLMSAV